MAAARILADRLVEAWVAENPAWAGRKDLRTLAVREVVAKCLYGADINDMAIEMCKLSLWLVSLDRDLPFSFVDDKVFVGNSLLGLTDIRQLRAMHIDPAKANRQQGMLDIFEVDSDSIIKRAIELRESLASPVESDDSPARSAAAKRRQLVQLQAVTADLRRLADGVVATGLALGGKPGRALDTAYEDLREAARKAYPGARGEADSTWLDSKIDHGLTPTVETDYLRWQPLHWIIEAADVMVDHGGFDAIIGNPPFLVSKKISGAMGVQVRDWIVEQVAQGRRGGADLVAYFVLRAVQLLAPHGCIGLITSKVIAEGDTREVALDPLVDDGLTLTRVRSSEAWPAKGVSVRYSMICGTRALIADAAGVVLDGCPVNAITSQLTARRRVSGDPLKLTSNVGRMQKGAFVLGAGFVLEPAAASSLIAADPASEEVIRPFLSGEDLNSSPTSTPSRFVIDFRDWPRERAAEFSVPYQSLESTVRPLRAKDKIKSRRENWWQFAVRAAGIHHALEEAGGGIAVAVVSKYGLPVRINAGSVISSAAAICPDPSFSTFAQMTSTCHNAWAWQWGSTMKSDLRYNPSDVFDTYPFLDASDELEELGAELHAARKAAMIERGVGLTKFYNVLNNSDLSDAADTKVAQIRSLHQRIDEAVIRGYGWSDVDLNYGFHPFPSMERWTISAEARLEVLDRLLEENHVRASADRTPQATSS